MGNDLFVLIFNLYNNNKKAERAAQEGDNELFMHLFNLFFVAQPLRWSSDSTELSVSSAAFTVEKKSLSLQLPVHKGILPAAKREWLGNKNY